MLSSLIRKGCMVCITATVYVSGGNGFQPALIKPFTATVLDESSPEGFTSFFARLFSSSRQSAETPEKTLTNSDGAMFCANRVRDGRFDTLPLTNLESIAWTSSSTQIASTPIVTDDGVFAIDAGNFRLIALSLADGSLVWETPIATSLSGAMISVDPITQRVILASGTQVSAYSTQSGMELWTTPLPTNVRSSPLIDEDNVYLALVNGTILALDQATGQQSWAYPGEGSIFGSIALSGNSLYFYINFINQRRGSVFALEASTGAFIWQRDFSVFLRGTPVLTPDRLIISEGVTLLSALDPSTGETLWQVPANLNPTNGVVVVDEAVYVLERDSQIVVFSLLDGSLLLQSFRTNIPSLSAPPVTAGDVLYFNEDGGRLCAFRISDLQPLWFFIPDGNGVSYQPAIHNGRVYVVGQPDGLLYALEGSTSL